MSGVRVRFRSVVLPPWCGKSPKVAEVLPLRYLHGLAGGQRSAPGRPRSAGARFDKGVMIERPDDVEEVAA